MRLSSIIASLVAWAFLFSHTQPAMAAGLFFSATGSGTTCSQSAPCKLQTAVASAGPNELISCADNSDNDLGVILKSLTIDCAGTAGSINDITISLGAVLTFRNLSIYQTGINLGFGTLTLENVHITGAPGNAIYAYSNGPSTIIARNCVFDTGGAGALFVPAFNGL